MFVLGIVVSTLPTTTISSAAARVIASSTPSFSGAKIQFTIQIPSLILYHPIATYTSAAVCKHTWLPSTFQNGPP